MVDDRSYEELTVEELKEELAVRDLSVSGHKTELISRLVEDDGVAEEKGATMAEKGAGKGAGSHAEAGDEAAQDAQLASTTQEVAELKAETKQNSADVKDLLARVTALESA